MDRWTEGDSKSLIRSVEITLEGALRRLLQEPQRTGNWGDVRGTADSVIAIQQCLPEERFPELRHYACEWLLARMEEDGPDAANWEEEVWDSAIATLALARYGPAREPVARAVRWLTAHFQNGSGNWNAEPWETLWALLAIHAASAHAETPLPEVDFERSLRWLISLRGTPGPGILVNWHYTALFSLVAQLYAAPEMRQVLTSDLRAALRVAHEESAAALAEGLAHTKGEETLWTNELWSNSLATWALADSSQLRPDLPGLDRLAGWYKRNLQDQEQCLTEDRAFACIALSHLLAGLGRASELAFTMRVRSVKEMHDSPEIQDIVDRCAAIVEKGRAEDIRERISARLRDFGDYVPRAPMFTKGAFSGYYTINLRDIPTNVVVIATSTLALTLAARNATGVFGEKAGIVAVWATLALGALATIAQLMNFSLPKLFSRIRSPDRRDD